MSDPTAPAFVSAPASVPDAVPLVTPAPPAPPSSPTPAGARAGEVAGEPLVTPPPGTPAAAAPTPEYGLARFDPHDAAHRYALLAVSAEEGRIVATPDPDERTAEGYLRMTARILLEPAKRTWRSIGVVSAQEGEGRSAAAVNLAVCLGRAKGRRGRVLLVFCDGGLGCVLWLLWVV